MNSLTDRELDSRAVIQRISVDEIRSIFNVVNDDTLIPIFAYGSLTSGSWNNPVLGDGRVFDGVAWLESCNYRLTESSPLIPFLVPVKNGFGSRVCGEVWYIPFRNLPRVDSLEGASDSAGDFGMYQRCLTGVIRKDDARLVDAIVYAGLSRHIYGERFVNDGGRRSMYCDWRTGSRYSQHPLFDCGEFAAAYYSGVFSGREV